MKSLFLLLVATSLIACSRGSETKTVTMADTLVDTLGKPAPTLPPVDSFAATPAADSSAPDTSTDVSTWKTYRSARYHFEFKYPPKLTAIDTFSTQDILPGAWRAMATEKEPGHEVVAVPIVHLGDRTSYPRFYDVEFRVGVADNLKNCKAGNGETTIGPIVLNGSTFNQFAFSDAAMMKYVTGISYRTGHDGRCYAVEQIRAGSNYRDSASKADINQHTLDHYYYLAGKIVKTFRFTDGK